MKITARQLRQIISETLEATLSPGAQEPGPKQKWREIEVKYDTGYSSREERERREVDDPTIRTKYKIAFRAGQLINMISNFSKIESDIASGQRELSAIEAAEDDDSQLKQEAINDVQAYLDSVKDTIKGNSRTPRIQK